MEMGVCTVLAAARVIAVVLVAFWLRSAFGNIAGEAGSLGVALETRAVVAFWL